MYTCICMCMQLHLNTINPQTKNMHTCMHAIN